MGKRTRAVSEDYESLANKIRKLEQNLMRTRRRDRHRTSRSSRRQSSSSSSDTTRSSSRSSSDLRSRSTTRQVDTAAARPLPSDTQYIEGVPIPPVNSTADAAVTTPLPSTSAAAAVKMPSTSIAFPTGTSAPATSAVIDVQTSPMVPTLALDDELLLILGDDPSQVKSFGKHIQPDLAIRLQHITRTGLPKDARKELMDKYIPPANCILIEAPTLNPEVVAAVPDAVMKRDKGIELRQKQRTSEISCVAEALTSLMSSEPKNTAIIQTLMDAIKLMCDSQHTDSTIRRSFILNTLKKDLKDQLQATKIDKLLFSEGLAETLRAAKAISKSGADMKPAAPVKQPPTKNKPPQKHLNWRAPPQNHRPKGTQRTKEPAHKDRPNNSSKPSSRQTQYRSRNRH